MPDRRVAAGRLFRLVLLLALPLWLAACGHNADPAPWAPDEAVQRARYVNDEPPSLTLITVVDNLGGRGDHAGVIINAGERVLYDPAGSFRHPALPQRNDVIFGFSGRAEEVYRNFHVRESHHMVTQRLYVSEEVAQRAMAAALAETKARPGQCASRTAAVLRAAGLNVRSTLFPRTQMEDFADLPGVQVEWHIADGVTPNRLGLDRTPHFAARMAAAN